MITFKFFPGCALATVTDHAGNKHEFTCDHEYKYVAIDEDGEVWAYSGRPDVLDEGGDPGMWYLKGTNCDVIGEVGFFPAWRDSLHEVTDVERVAKVVVSPENSPHAVVDTNGNLIAITANAHLANLLSGRYSSVKTTTRPATEHDVLTMLGRVK